jgi:adenine-specific DNA glycosylase
MNKQCEIPPPKPRATPTMVQHHTVIIRRAGSDLIMLEQRNGSGMWSGLWQTPTIEADKALDETALAALLPVGVRDVRKRGELTHRTTHRHIQFHVYAARAAGRRGRATWRRIDDMSDLPMSSAQRRVLSFARHS